MTKDFAITITNPMRRIEWLDMLGTSQLNVKSLAPELATLPGFDEPQPVYYIDLDTLPHRQYQRLVQKLAAKFNLSPHQVRQDLAEHGVPIPAADCTLTIHNPHKWLLHYEPN